MFLQDMAIFIYMKILFCYLGWDCLTVGEKVRFIPKFLPFG